jgi:anaerobic selenocysteine-containing dehydrogenase
MADFNRRDFIKIGLGGALGFSLAEMLHATLLGALENLPQEVSRTTGLPFEVIPTICQACSASCGIVGFLNGTRVVGIMGNPNHLNNRGKVCAKGIAGINLLYDPERVLYPLKRIGMRGEGKWKRISWEDAYNDIATRLRSIRGGTSSARLLFEAGREENLTKRFFNAFESCQIAITPKHGNVNSQLAHKLTWGKERGISDVEHSRYILCFGANPFESHNLFITLAQRMVEARIKNGAKLVTFDVRDSNTAGRSDEWFPVKPGTDGLIALAMAQVIMQKGLYDRQFIERWTTITPDELMSHLSPYTPERVEQEVGIKSSDIIRIATEFAQCQPSTVVCGEGLSSHKNGVYSERAVMLLNIIVGTINKRGGYLLPADFSSGELEPVPKAMLEINRNMDLLNHVEQGKEKAGAYITYLYNPVYAGAYATLLKAVLKDENKIPYFVAIDTHMTESSMYADMVLPAATYLESWGLEVGISPEGIPSVGLQQPIAQLMGEVKTLDSLKENGVARRFKPRGGAKSFNEMCIHLAKRIGNGMERYFDFEDTEHYIKKVVSSIAALEESGGFNKLAQEGVWFNAARKAPYEASEAHDFRTSTGKIEVFSQELKNRGFDPLPVYAPIEEHKDLKPGEFILTLFSTNVTAEGFANGKWLKEIQHSNPLWINAEKAKALGINDGDRVRVVSSLGSLEAKVVVVQGVYPDVVAMAKGFGHQGYGHIAKAEKYTSSDPDTELLWWEREGNGVNPQAIIPLTVDSIGGGQAWMDTKVRLEKI